MKQPISPLIFRAYDIRGVYNNITPEVFYKIGLATGIYIKHTLRGTHITVEGDIRQSNQSRAYAFIAGVTATGVHIEYTGTTSFG